MTFSKSKDKWYREFRKKLMCCSINPNCLYMKYTEYHELTVYYTHHALFAESMLPTQNACTLLCWCCWLRIINGILPSVRAHTHTHSHTHERTQQRQRQCVCVRVCLYIAYTCSLVRSVCHVNSWALGYVCVRAVPVCVYSIQTGR